MFEDSEEKYERGGGAVESDAHKTPINETTIEDINALLEDSYEVDDDRLPDTDKKPIAKGDTD